MAGQSRKISAASARSHTRRKNQASSTFPITTGICTKLSIALLVGLLALSYQAIQPPPPKICGSPTGPSITSARIKLKDGRHISYIETGVPKQIAKYKIIFLHGLFSCKYDAFSISKEIVDEYGIYMLSFDRPGYGESDPHPRRFVKSNAQDIEEIADILELGEKFFVVGFSLGGELVWGCLKYIPHRLSGAALVAPASNYWWPSFPSNLSDHAISQQLKPDQWAYRVAHYAPWLTYWWNTQKWFPYSSIFAQRIEIMSPNDLKVLSNYTKLGQCKDQARQQGEFESIHRDLNIALGRWEFDPMDLENPFPNNQGAVYLWQGDEDRIVSPPLAHFISQKLSWIRYHEVPNAGHMFPLGDGMGDRIVKTLIVGDD